MSAIAGLGESCTVTDADVRFLREILNHVKQTFMFNSPYYSFLLSNLRVVASCNVPVMATDGTSLYINPQFVRRVIRDMPLAEAGRLLTGLIMHELEHVTRLHPFRLQRFMKTVGYPPELVQSAYNVAADAQINDDLRRSGFKLLDEVIYPETVKERFDVDVKSRPAETAAWEILRRLTLNQAARRAQKSQGQSQTGQREQQEQQGQGGQEEREEQEGQGIPRRQKGQGKRKHKGGRGQGGESREQEDTEKAGGAGGQGGEREEREGRGGSGGRGQERREEEKPGGGDAWIPNRFPEDVVTPEEGREIGRDGKVVQDASPDIKKAMEEAEKGDPEKAMEAVEEAVKNAITRSYTAAKNAGKAPGHLDRVIGEILKPAENWRNIIRSVMQGVLGSSVRRTWSVPNRKLPGARPGRVTKGVDEVYVLMDVSGSIGEKELTRFASEIAGIAKEVGAKVTVIPWDVGVHGKQTIRGRSGASRIKVTGGGGTELLPSLREAVKMIKPGRPVVILSDWVTADDPAELVRELEKLARTNDLVLASVHSEPPNVRGAKTVKLPV